MSRYRVVTIVTSQGAREAMPIVESADGIWLATDPEGWHRLDVRSLEELDEAFVRALFRSDAVSLSPIKQTASHSFFDMLD